MTSAAATLVGVPPTAVAVPSVELLFASLSSTLQLSPDCMPALIVNACECGVVVSGTASPAAVSAKEARNGVTRLIVTTLPEEVTLNVPLPDAQFETSASWVAMVVASAHDG